MTLSVHKLAAALALAGLLASCSAQVSGGGDTAKPAETTETLPSTEPAPEQGAAKDDDKKGEHGKGEEASGFALAVKGRVTIRPEAGAGLKLKSDEVAAANSRVEAIRLSSERKKVDVLKTTTTDGSGAYEVGLDGVPADDVLLVVAYENEQSSGQALLTVADYAKGAKGGKLDVQLDVSIVSTIAAWILLKKEVDLSSGIGQEKLAAVNKLVEETIASLGSAADDKSPLEVAQLVVEAPGFNEQLTQLVSTTKERDPCDAESWDFLATRPPVSEVFEDAPPLVNLTAGLTADANGLLMGSPSRVTDAGWLVYSGAKAKGLIDAVALSLVEQMPGQPLKCFDSGTAAFGACPAQLSTNATGGVWSLKIPKSKLANGGIYVATLQGVNTRCNAVLAETTVTVMWDSAAPAVTLAGAPQGASNASNLDVAVQGSEVATYAFALRSDADAADCEGAAYSAPLAATTRVREPIGTDGAKRLCVIAYDAAGNAGAPATAFWTKDATPPASVALAGAPAALTNVAALSVGVSGADAAEYRWALRDGAADCDGASWSAWTALATPLATSATSDGAKLLCVSGRDAAGNEQAAPTTAAFTLDTHAPVIAALADAVSGTAVARAPAVTDLSAVTYAWSKVSGPGALTFSAPAAKDSSVAADADGVYQVRLTATDALGQSATQDFLLGWDTAKPTATIATTAADPTNTLPIPVTVTFSEAVSGFTAADLQVTGGAASGFNAVSTTVYTFNVTTAGAVTIAVPADAGFDAAGNGNLAPAALSLTYDPSVLSLAFTVDAGNPASVKSTSVDLILADETGVAQYRKANGSDCSAASWTAFGGGPIAHTLTAGDGAKTVCLQVKNGAGTPSATATDSVLLDQTEPGATVATSGTLGPSSTAGAATTLSGTASDAGSGLASVEVSVQAGAGSCLNGAGTAFDAACPQWRAATGTASWSLSVNDAVLADTTVYTVSVRGTDAAGNVLATPATGSFTWDGAAPLAAFTLGAGDPAATASPGVSLVLADATGVAQFRKADGADCSAASWTAYSGGVIAHTLPAGDGAKTVCLEVRDSLGNASGTATDAITLDTTAPVATFTVGAGDPAATSSTAVQLVLADATGVAEFRKANGSDCSGATWTAYAGGAIGHSLGTGDGLKTVCLQVRDALGNASGTATDTITLNQSGPSPAFVLSAGDPASTAATAVQLVLADATGVADYRKADGSDCSAASWTAYAGGNVAHTLPAGDGTKTVCLQVRDGLGNASATATDSIVLDTTPPNPAFVIGSDDPAATASTAVQLVLTDGTGVAQYRKANGTDCSAASWTAYSGGTIAHTLPTGDGAKSVCLEVRDGLGNVSATATDAITLDTTAPSPAFVLDAGDPASTTLRAVQLVLTDATGVAQYRKADGASCAAATWTSYSGGVLAHTLPAGAGAKTVCLEVRDALGNASATATDGITLAAPTVAFTSPAGGSSVTAAGMAAVALSGSCSENGQSVALSGAATASATCAGGTWSANVDLSAAGQGALTLRADHATSEGTAATQATLSLTKDTVAPTVSITSPAASSVVNAANAGALTIAGACSENGRTVTVGGAAAGSATCASGNWSATLDASAVADGALTFTADLTDTAGNAAAQATLSLTKDAAAPSLGYPAAPSGTVGQAFSLSPTTLSANGGSIASCAVKGGTTALPGGLAVNGTTCVVGGTPAASLATTTITIHVTDSAGNAADATFDLYVAPDAPVLSFSGATGTTGSVGQAMSVAPTTLSANGASVTACGVKGGTTALPAGLTVDAATCVISGVPTAAAAAATYTLVATNAAGPSADATISLTVAAGVPTLSYAGATGTAGTVGQAMSVAPTTLAANGASVTACDIKGGTTALPGTLSVDATTCVISGTPTAALASTTYTLIATNAAGASAQATVSLSVAAAVPTLSYAASTGTTVKKSTALSVTPSTLAANGASVTACGIKGGTTALPAGLSVSATTCVISGTPSAPLAPTAFTLVATNAAGASADATVTLTVTDVPTLSYAGASGTTGKINTALSVSPTTLAANNAAITACGIKGGTTALPGTLSVNATSCVISGTPTATLGATTYTLVATNAAGTSANATVSLSVTADKPTLSYAGATGTSGAVGQAMSISPTTLLGNGASVTACAIKGGTTALPTGLTVNATTCVVSGTPTVGAANVTYTIVATNSGGTSADASLTLNIGVNPPTLAYSGATQNATAGSAFSVSPTTLTANGAAVTACGVKGGTTALPAGLSVNATTCVISGVPTAASTATAYTLVATNSAGNSADATVTIAVNAAAPALSFTGAAGTTGVLGGSLAVAPTTLSANGAPLTACGIKAATTALPAYLSVDPSTCVISGTPDAPLASTTYTLVATNAVGSSADATVTLQVVNNVCDSGDLATTCTISTAHTLNGYSLSGAGDLVVTTGGSLATGIGQSLVIAMGGDVSVNAGSITANLTKLSAANVTIAAGASVNADALGYAGGVNGAGAGPGGGTNSTNSGGGGSHGGVGGKGYDGNGGGAVYGSDTQPVTFGSGGGGHSTGGAGGGAIKITVTGTLTVNGTLSANGAAAPVVNSGGGAGGSLWLTVGAMAGTGNIFAKGGTGGGSNGGGGGGGGRIAIYSPTKFVGGVSVAGGSGAVSNGQTTAGGAGVFYLDGTNICDSGTLDTTCVVSAPVYLGASYVVTGAGTLTITTGGALLATSPSPVTISLGGDLNVDAGSITANIAALSAANVTIASGATVTADGYGYAGGQNGAGAGPGAGTHSTNSGGGGSHGGVGGKGYDGNGGGAVYGSDTQPVTYGSGGGGHATGGAGGGAIKITTTGTLTVNGTLSANGVAAPVANSGGGAGGSLWLTAGAMAGTGNILAKGGNGGASNGGGAGGGGRVAIYAPTKFSGTVSVAGGAAAVVNGQTSSGATGVYYLDATNICDSGTLDGSCVVSSTTYVGNGFVISGNGDLTVAAGGSLRTVSPTDVVSVSLGGDFVVSGGSVVANFSSITAANVTVGSGSITGNIASLTAGNVTIAAGTTVSADAAGYAGGQNGAGTGPGAGTNSTNSGGGGSHGGVGGKGYDGNAGGAVYGSDTNPVTYGSGGGGHATGGAGGGAIKITATGTLTVNGTLSANGAAAPVANSGGGAGGSLWLTAGAMTGTGNIFAKGGTGGASNGGGAGGGGRVAIFSPTKFSGAVSVAGGAAAVTNGQTTPGAVGVFYLGSTNICDSGTVDDTCVVSSPTYLGSSYAVSGTGSLTVAAGGSLVASNAAAVSLTLSGDLVVSGGAINANFSSITAANVTVSSGSITGNIASLTAGNVTIAAGTTVSADAAGYAGGQNGAGTGPGAGTNSTNSGGGGSHGGVGGKGYDGNAGGAVYGSDTNPVTYGSGGGGHSIGGAGGGAIKITATGTLTVNGTLSANGAAAPVANSGGGAGGSLWLTAGAMTGTGNIFAKGGTGGASNGGGAGGGGRVAIFSPTKFSGAVSVAGGTAAVTNGQTTAGAVGVFYLDPTNICDSGTLSDTCTISTNTYVGRGYAISGPGNLIVASGGSVVAPVATDPVSLDLGGDLTVSGGTLTASFTSVVARDVNITSGTMSGNVASLAARNVTIAAGASLNANGFGYAGGQNSAGAGTGPGTNSTNAASGGGHGGAGGKGYDNNAGGAAYGSDPFPTTWGSGGGGHPLGGAGGGAIKLIVAGTLTVDGTLAVNGATPGARSGGGAGGSLWLEASTITGTGTLSARGGGGGVTFGGGGGGGRIALYYQTDSFTGTRTVQAGAGGTGGGSSAGTDGRLMTYPLGTAYHRIFVKAAGVAPSLGAASNYDAACASAATAAGFSNTIPWKALLSSSGGSAASRLTIAGPVINTRGDAVALTAADLWDGTLGMPIRYTEARADAGAVGVWTGSAATGAADAATCVDWTSSAAGDSGRVGVANATEAAWASSATVACSATYAVYCVSQ